MSNTQLRIVSALIMASLVVLGIYVGPVLTWALMGLLGVITVDEIHVNFFRNKRFSFGYFISLFMFLIPYCYLFYYEHNANLLELNNIIAIAVNLILIVYLFFTHIDSNHLVRILEKFPQTSAIMIGFSFISLATVVLMEKWQALLAVLLLVNFGMDTGAWFFGKNFGKHKLWETVSPKKTVEGLLGGMFTSSVVGCLAWYLIFGEMKTIYLVLFAILGAMSQVGDLVQSKLKRQVGVKDSSALIPGHGGVYDRVDSLIFLSPFYVLVLKVIH